MRYLSIYFFLLFTTTLSSQTWKDPKIESLFLENNFDEAKKYIEGKLASESSQSKEQNVYYFTKLSHSYLRNGQFNKAFEYAKKSVANSKSFSDKLLKAESWRAMSYACIRTSQLDSAIVYAEKMYRYGKENNNYDFTRAALMSMGNISIQQEKYSESIKFYSDVLELTESHKNNSNLKVDYYNIGLAYSRFKKPEVSNKFLEKALNKAVHDNDEILLARIYGSLLDNYSGLNDIEKRIYYQEKANSIAKKNNNIQLLAMGYTNMMQWCLKGNNPTKTIEYGKKTLSLLKNNSIKQLEVRVDSMMYAALKTIKRNDEALIFLESYTHKKKKLSSFETNKNLNELIIKYDVENKNLKIKNQEVQIIAAKRERNIYILLASILLLFVSGVIILKMNKRLYITTIYKKEKYNESLFSQLKSINNIQENTIKLRNEITIDEKSESLYHKIIEKIENEKLFLNPELDQKTLIRLLGTNKKYLYEAIKNHDETNFRGIINRLRVNHAKKNIEKYIIEGETANFSQLYLESGFNANSSYYRVFKSITGLSPLEYSIEFKKEIKINNKKSNYSNFTT